MHAVDRAPRTAAGTSPSVIHQRGAYAVIRDDSGRVLVVKTANGRCYLPGGRIEPGENARQALLREIAEECGWSAEVGVALRRCNQTIFGGRIALDAGYWQASLTAPLAAAAEHELLWLDPAEAKACLHRASDRTALDELTPIQSR